MGGGKVGAISELQSRKSAKIWEILCFAFLYFHVHVQSKLCPLRSSGVNLLNRGSTMYVSVGGKQREEEEKKSVGQWERKAN